MIKYEYLVLELYCWMRGDDETHSVSERREQELNEAGENGWELVSVSNGHAYLKRQAAE